MDRQEYKNMLVDEIGSIDFDFNTSVYKIPFVCDALWTNGFIESGRVKDFYFSGTQLLFYERKIQLWVNNFEHPVDDDKEFLVTEYDWNEFDDADIQEIAEYAWENLW